MARGQSETIAVPVPRQAMLHPPSTSRQYECHRLLPGSKGPGHRCADLLIALLQGQSGGCEVVAVSAAVNDAPSCEMLPGIGRERPCMRCRRLCLDACRVTGPAIRNRAMGGGSKQACQQQAHHCSRKMSRCCDNSRSDNSFTRANAFCAPALLPCACNTVP